KFGRACRVNFVSNCECATCSFDKTESLLTFTQIRTIFHPSPRRQKGRSRDRHGTWCGLRWQQLASADLHPTTRLQPTAKSFGPGAAILVLRLRISVGNGGKKGRFPGESTYKPSNHCAGKAGMSRLYLSNPCAFFHYHCPRCCGRSRRPAFPA